MLEDDVLGRRPPLGETPEATTWPPVMVGNMSEAHMHTACLASFWDARGKQGAVLERVCPLAGIAAQADGATYVPTRPGCGLERCAVCFGGLWQYMARPASPMWYPAPPGSGASSRTA